MTLRYRMQKTVLSLFLVAAVFLPGSLWAQQKKVAVTNMTTPFGTPMYTQGVAFEEVFKKAKSWVEWKAQETPGAMYIVKYVFKNQKKIETGQVPQVVSPSSGGVLPFLIEGRKPFTKINIPNNRALFSMPSYSMVFVTFDPNIKSLKDLAGKKVGIAEKSRPFQGVLAIGPYFMKGLKNWKKVKWQFLGAANSKDALLNNKIDAHYATFMGSVDQAKDGSFSTRKLAPGPALLELMNSGRKLYFIPWEPEVIKKSYDFSKDMLSYPILVKKGAVEGLDREIYFRLSVGTIAGDVSMPDNVLQEIIRVRHEYRKELGKYHATLKLLPDNPYPAGIPDKWVHPGVKKAMRNLNIPIPGE